MQQFDERQADGSAWLRFSAVAGIACGLVGLAACGSSSAAGNPTAPTITVTTVGCDGSITTTVTAAPTSGGLGQAVAQGTVTPQIVGGGPATPTPPPTPRVVVGSSVQLSAADGGSTIVVSVGTSIRADLGPAGAPFCWSAPTSSDVRIVEQLSSTSGNDRAGHGWFRSRAPGTTTIQATEDPRCSPACGAASWLWRVDVEVTAT